MVEWFDNGGIMLNVNRMETKKNIGDRVLAIRKQLGLTQSEFGALLGGLKKSAISAYEKNDNPLSVMTAIKVAALGQISIDELLLGKASEPEDCTACGNEVVAHRADLSYFENRVVAMLRALDPRDYPAVLEFLTCVIATSPYIDEE